MPLGRVACLLACFFVAASAWGGPVPGAVHNWDAGLDLSDNGVWEDTGTQADRPWTLSGPARIEVDGPGILTHAYRFDGVDDTALAFAENRSGNHDTSFELWFRPQGLTSDGTVRPMFEHGNGPRGVSLGLLGDTLVFAYGASPDFNSLSFDLDAGDDGLDNPHFIQAVGVIDDAGNQMRLYVDGALAASVGIASASNNDFSSNDDLGLGMNQSQGGGGQSAPGYTWGGAFGGDIALLREYRFDFTDAEALQNYLHITTPEPAAWLLAALALAGAASTRRAS